MKSSKKHVISVVAFIVCAALVFLGCSANGAGDQPSTDSGRKTGYFIDSAVAGLSYVTSSGLKGVTDANGSFSYNPGDTVQFFLGETLLVSSVSAQEVISPLMLCGAASLTDSSPEATMATNLVRLFLALDTGTNAYGMTLPTTLGDIDIPDLNVLLSSATFEADAKTVVADAKKILIAEVTLPDADAAKDHWEISEKLAAEIAKMKDTDNFILTVKVPDGFEKSKLNLSYNAKTMPADMKPYVSGTSRFVPEDGSNIVTFTGYMHPSYWQMTLSLFKSIDKVQVGDIFSFYGTDGFTIDPPVGFPLNMNAGYAVLSADLSSGTGSLVQSVSAVSGNLIVPATLPDGRDFSSGTDFTQSFTLYCAIMNSVSDQSAMFPLGMQLPPKGEWSIVTENSIEYDVIPYTTQLATGYKYSIQLFYGTTYSDATRFRAYAWASINEPLVSEQTGKDLKTTKWEGPTGSVYASMRSISDATKTMPVYSLIGGNPVLELR